MNEYHERWPLDMADSGQIDTDALEQMLMFVQAVESGTLDQHQESARFLAERCRAIVEAVVSKPKDRRGILDKHLKITTGKRGRKEQPVPEEESHQRAFEVIQLGQTQEAVAEAHGVDVRTVQRDCKRARDFRTWCDAQPDERARRIYKQLDPDT